MEYNLLELKEKQKQLDSYIHKLHDVTYETTLKRRILAFLVELGELANETRCFKFWSLKCPSSDDVIFEEYIDGVHFILSIGIAINYDFNQNIEVKENNLSLVDQFFKVYQLASNFDNSAKSYQSFVSEFLNLGVKLGLTKEKLDEYYQKKWLINFERQNNKY